MAEKFVTQRAPLEIQEAQVLNEARIPPANQLLRLEDASLHETEKQWILQFFKGVGFEEVFFADEQHMGALGLFNGKKIFLSKRLLLGNARDRIETFIHENTHMFEARAKGLLSGVLDSSEDISNKLTHQQDGAFRDFYHIGDAIFLNTALAV